MIRLRIVKEFRLNESPIHFLCENCKQHIEFPAQDGGSVQSCSECGEYVDVPRFGEVQPIEPQKTVLPNAESAEPTIGEPREWLPVICVCGLVIASNALVTFCDFFPWLDVSPFIRAELTAVVVYAVLCAVVCWIVHRSRIEWAELGIVRIHWLVTLFVGCSLCGLTLVGWIFVSVDFPDSFFAEVAPSKFPVSTTDYVAMFFSCSLYALAHVFVVCGYIMTRFEKLLKSKRRAVLATSFVCALQFHPDIATVVWVFVSSIARCSGFCLIRCVWPIALAAAIGDILSFVVQ